MRTKTNKHTFPTARNTSQIRALSLRVGLETVSGETVSVFLSNVILFIEARGRLSYLEIPFHTSGKNLLVSYDGHHSDGRLFSASCIYATKSGATLHINTNHPRFFALRQGARLLAAVGISSMPDL
jgi:hypothetical protein